MANFSMAGGGHGDGMMGGGRGGGGLGHDPSLRNVAKRANHVSLPGLSGAASRSLFIFSDENFIRKYAKLIIEWGYPFTCKKNISISSIVALPQCN